MELGSGLLQGGELAEARRFGIVGVGAAAAPAPGWHAPPPAPTADSTCKTVSAHLRLSQHGPRCVHLSELKKLQDDLFIQVLQFGPWQL